MSNNKNLDKKLANKLDKWEEEAKTAIKWISVDPDGAVWGYSTKPKIGRFANWYDSDTGGVYLGTTKNKHLRRNWEKTLRKVNYE